MSKLRYECENCKSVLDKEKAIKKCSVCKKDVCEYCEDMVFCANTRAVGHKGCFTEEGGESYLPEEHSRKACKVCKLIYCDCKES